MSTLFRYDVMMQCWADEPKERPNFSQLRAMFDSLISAQGGDAKSYIDLRTIDTEQAYYNQLLPTDNSDEFLVLTGQELPYDHLNTEEINQQAYNHLEELVEEDEVASSKLLQVKEKEDKPVHDCLELEEKYPSYDHLPEVGVPNLAYRDSLESSSSSAN